MVLMFLAAILTTGRSRAEGNENRIKKEVWEKEMLYWESLKKKDLDTLMNLWHPGLLAWPNFSEKPVGKKRIRNSCMVKKLFPL